VNHIANEFKEEQGGAESHESCVCTYCLSFECCRDGVARLQFIVGLIERQWHCRRWGEEVCHAAKRFV
jgi:hypothetical protein